MIRSFGMATGLSVVLLLAAHNSYADDIAAVPESLRNDPAYASYARIQIQLSFLSDPVTANLPVFVDSPLPGVIDLRGSVPDQRTKDRMVQNAMRISGLRVRQTLRIVTNETNELPSDSTDGLVPAVKETLATLFPELSGKIKVTATANGVVTLEGTAPSYEACLLLSQSAKSQPGCKAAICKLQVPVNPATQKINVNELGTEAVFAAQLPNIPQPISDIPMAGGEDKYTIPATSNPAIAADDAAPQNLADKQIREEIKKRLEKDADLKVIGFEIDVQDGIVSLSGSAQSKAQVELATAIAAEVPNVTKVIAKSRPVSIQRFRPVSVDATKATPQPVKRRLFGFIPWGRSSEDSSPVQSRRFRDAIRRTIQRRCDRDLQDLEVKVGADGKSLLITGRVATPQKRVAVFKQLDNLAELRSVGYDAVVEIVDTDSK